eukprot:COSAG02_NODE_396_length_23126_cov_282.150258_6_plen_34_part_00
MNQFVPNHQLVASMPRIEDPGAIKSNEVQLNYL